MNSWNGIGRLTADIELRKTQSGKSVASFTLAVDKFGDGADFIQCVAWEKTADILARYTTKGSQIGVSGHIQTRNYEDKTGNRVYVTEVVARQVDLLGSKKEKEEYTPPQDEVVEDFGGPTLDISGDDLPF